MENSSPTISFSRLTIKKPNFLATSKTEDILSPCIGIASFITVRDSNKRANKNTNLNSNIFKHLYLALHYKPFTIVQIESFGLRNARLWSKDYKVVRMRSIIHIWH